jgi:hypothetical protein
VAVRREGRVCVYDGEVKVGDVMVDVASLVWRKKI